MIIAIVGGTLIDGTGRDPVPNSSVMIEDGRVTKAGSTRSIDVPRGAAVLDATGSTVIPGIIDCQVHLTYRSRDLRRHLQNPPSYNILASTEIPRIPLNSTLSRGVLFGPENQC